MMYSVIEEASEAVCYSTDSLIEAIEEAKKKAQGGGKYLVLDENDLVMFDTNPGVTFKF